MVCPKCKAVNPNDFRFCRKCKSPLDLPAVADEKGQEDVKPEPVPPPGGIAAGSATATSAVRVAAAWTSPAPVTETSAPETTARNTSGPPLRAEDSPPAPATPPLTKPEDAIPAPGQHPALGAADSIRASGSPAEGLYAPANVPQPPRPAVQPATAAQS